MTFVSALRVDHLVGGCDPIYTRQCFLQATAEGQAGLFGPNILQNVHVRKAWKEFRPKIYLNWPNMTVAAAQTKRCRV